MSHLPFQFFAWTASILFAAESIQSKFISKHKIQNPWLFNILWLSILLIINTIICLVAGAGIPSVWGNILWTSGFFAVGMTFFILSNYELDVSVLTPLSNLHTVFVVILGLLFLNEHLTTSQIWLIVAMVGAGVLVTIDEKFSLKSFFNKGVAYTFAWMLSFALMAMFFNKAGRVVDFWTLNLWYSLIGTLLVAIITAPFFKRDIETLDTNQVGNVFLMAIAGALGNLASNKAFASNIGISGAIIYLPLSLIVVMILSPFFPKLLEHHTWKVYTIRAISAAVLIYAGLRL